MVDTDPEKQDWDVIIVGTGMGGATLGYTLARAGKRVLFCEKGRSHLGDRQALLGDYAESFFDRPEVPQAKHCDILARAGRCTETVEDRSTAWPRRHIPFIGEGTGGSSALYGMAMERFFPADFHPRANFPQVQVADTSLPESWPISYEDLQPYYAAAERLYRVRGSPDPLRTDSESACLAPPLPLSPGNQDLYDFLQQKGLHPYCLPLAYEGVPDCPGCQGYLCAKPCKNDSSRICLEPALNDYGARLLDQCSVIRLEADRDRVTGVVCSWQGKTITLRSKLVVLAAGALQTPALLLRSTSPVWPNGLANESGLVGRNLMRHGVDLYAVFVNSPPYRGNVKEIAFNDCYHADGCKLGSVQSFGVLPPASVIVAHLQQDLRDGRWPPMAAFFGLIKPLLRSICSYLFSRTLILTTVMEDIPHPENRVLLSEDGRLVLKYQLHPHDQERLSLFRQKMRDILKPYHFMLIKQAENNDRIAHACGTCRFGADAQTSVLDSVNRAHGVVNLYVVDSSFFPSSGGINPSLTIAANALRVADHISDHG